jgi:hypothetical protein
VLHAELAPHGFTVMAVALDRNPDDPRPYVEAASPTFPCLVDSEHVLADLYGIINVPTVIWIDEHGRIARPNDVAFGAETFKELSGIDSDAHHAALRAWVRDGTPPLAANEIGDWLNPPSDAEQLARAEFALAWYLHRHGRASAAETHFVRAGELAPHDFTIRRGSMPIRGMDPMGADFADMFSAWLQNGKPYYPRLLAKRL